jgi:hypothetical protein
MGVKECKRVPRLDGFAAFYKQCSCSQVFVRVRRCSSAFKVWEGQSRKNGTSVPFCLAQRVDTEASDFEKFFFCPKWLDGGGNETAPAAMEGSELLRNVPMAAGNIVVPAGDFRQLRSRSQPEARALRSCDSCEMQW